MNATVAALAQCYPFNQFDVMDLAQYWGRMDHRRCKRGQALLRNNVRSGMQFTYLVSGVAELRRSFFDRQSLTAGMESTLQPLDHLLIGDGGQIVALEECEAVTVPRELIDEVLEITAQRNRVVQTPLAGKCVFMPGDVVDANHYEVRPLNEAEYSEEFWVTDSSIETDWMSRFLQLPLAHQLPASTIQHLLACLQSMDVAQGEMIIRRGETGDAMYVLTRGIAAVRTDPGSTFAGREFPLIPGDYFGEESLVADTVRNAAVVMESDGTVARLDRDTFMELIYPHLVRTADEKLIRAMQAGDDRVQLIDVRFPVEFRRQARTGSRNIPISELRAAFESLLVDRPCVVVNCGGRRSELAVFLLRQAGFDAYLLGKDQLPA